MYIRIVTFALTGITPEQYEAQANAIADQFMHWPGLQWKIWLADRSRNTYGGIYLFDDKQHADQSRHSALFVGLTSNTHFTDLTITEYDTLTTATALTTALAAAAA